MLVDHAGAEVTLRVTLDARTSTGSHRKPLIPIGVPYVFRSEGTRLYALRGLAAMSNRTYEATDLPAPNRAQPLFQKTIWRGSSLAPTAIINRRFSISAISAPATSTSRGGRVLVCTSGENPMVHHRPVENRYSPAFPLTCLARKTFVGSEMPRRDFLQRGRLPQL
jgi:hypothetical protein